MRSSRRYSRRVANAMSGHVAKIAAMWRATSSPSARSPAVWFSKTMPGACSAHDRRDVVTVPRVVVAGGEILERRAHAQLIGS